MTKRETQEVKNPAKETFEAPELTTVGEAGDVVQGVPYAGWDHRGMSAPEFEFQTDDDQS